ncbi:alpha/beta-hydrolase [Teratosphaeria destructans]|uniref:Alpha/beta-hydrolase n=1 Tax=Teratosphaeria destructans TaxID=418781 RepID=A0A9W7SJL5_9PEZI|nr:alpha/beta-hydrolase [Teratosphaeria destructans]
MLVFILQFGLIAVGTAAGLYVGLLCLLTTSFFQSHVVYLHAIQMTWFKDLNIPEIFGFLRNQVTPFYIRSAGGQILYAWHILPVELYRRHEQELVSEPSGLVSDISSRLAFRLLRDDPDARLVIHFHGAAGTVGSGHRVPNYRALSAGQPEKIHVLTFDYRGFGLSPGSPSERGLILDAVTVVEWAMRVAKIPPSRILMFGQSLGTAVNIAVADHFVQQTPSITFAGHLLVAPFCDVATLVSTYRVAGVLPILSPVAKIPVLFDYLRTYIRDKWPTKDRLASFVRASEANEKPYRITIIHAEDDYDIPWQHSAELLWHAVNASVPGAVTPDELDIRKEEMQVDLGSAGRVAEWRTSRGIVREEILKYGLHDVLMGNPIVTLAVMRLFEA